MGKCTRCGRKGLFLHVTNGLCDNCASTVRMEEEQAELKHQMDEMSATLENQQALFEKISTEAKEDGIAKAKAENARLSTENLQLEEKILQGKAELADITTKNEKLQKSASNAEQKVRRSKELIKAILNASEAFSDGSDKNIEALLQEADELMKPTVTLTLQCLDMKELRKRY